MTPDTSQDPQPLRTDSVRSWPRFYALVLGELAVLVVLFYLFTKAFE